MGTRDGDGAVDGRLRIGRGSFGRALAFLSDDGLALRRANVSCTKVALIGVEGELKARPADRGRRGVISWRFPLSCIVDGRFLFDTDPEVDRGSPRFVAVDGRSSCFGLPLLLCVVVLVAVDGRWLVAVVLESPDVEGRTTPFVCKEEPVLGLPGLVAALCFLTSLVWDASLLTRFRACCSTTRHLLTNSLRSGSIGVPLGWFLANTSFDLRTTADEITARCLGTSKRCGKSGMASLFNNGIFAPRNLRDSIACDLSFLSDSDPSGEPGVGKLSGVEVETTKM